MKTFIQSASLDELGRFAAAGMLDGVALSLLDLADAAPHPDGPDARLGDHVAEIDRRFAVSICVPVSAVTSDDIYRHGRNLARVTDRVVVQVPFIEDAMVPIRRLVADGIRVCATHVFTPAQAYLAGKIGASIVMVSVDELDAHGQPSAQVVSEIRAVIDRARLECDLGVSSPRSATHFSGCLLAGADLTSMSPATARSLVTHALTDRGVDRFMYEVNKIHFAPRSV